MKDESKKLYISPKIESTTIELEQGIAAGSVQPQAQQEWETTEDDTRTISW